MKRKSDSIGSNTLKGIRETKEVDDPKVHPLGTSLAYLPDDIIIDILFKLPIKSILICKFVCKSWHSIISNPHFAQLHFKSALVSALVRTSNSRRVSRTLHLLDFDEFKSNDGQHLLGDNDCGHVCLCKHSPKPNCNNHMKLEVKFKLPLRDSNMVLDTMLETRRRDGKRTNIACKPKDDKFDVVNSCNGLFCLCDPFERNPLVVCNLITGEFIRLPQSDNDKLMGHRINSGFGYPNKTNEYKVIRIYAQRHLANIDYAAAEIHSLGTRLWRNIEYHGPYWSRMRSPTYFNGSLHWLVFNYTKISILCFDLESETFNSFPCPSAISSITYFDAKSRIGFGELNGSLYICSRYANAKCLRFWTMKTFGDGQSWTKVLDFNHDDSNYWPHLHQPIIGSAGVGILIYDHCRFFIYYEPQKHLFRFLEGRGTSITLEPIFHIPSLIRLKDAVKGDNIEEFNVHLRCATFKLREDKQVLFLANYKTDLEDMSMDFQNFWLYSVQWIIVLVSRLLLICFKSLFSF